ncbi:hypothetical protein Scep_014725 [Stephania cephalantha]|uniref:Uncharacterized protein n=1 Tax=Stephania cephalantha TaxID=152367 RepID=A0AAP0J1T0_9MAGN
MKKKSEAADLGATAPPQRQVKFRYPHHGRCAGSIVPPQRHSQKGQFLSIFRVLNLFLLDQNTPLYMVKRDKVQDLLLWRTKKNM